MLTEECTSYMRNKTVLKLPVASTYAYMQVCMYTHVYAHEKIIRYWKVYGTTVGWSPKFLVLHYNLNCKYTQTISTPHIQNYHKSQINQRTKYFTQNKSLRTKAKILAI